MQKQSKTHLEVRFRGHVQGVGFRFTAAYIARDFDLDGFVRNLPDGSVEMVAEGARSELEQFVTRILHSQMRDFIQQKDLAWSDEIQGYKKFRVAYL